MNNLRKLIQLRPTWRFLWLFVFVNGLLFLPLYLLNQESSTFWPIAAAADGGWINQLLLWRQNLDPFRLSVELTVVMALWLNLRWLRRPAVRRLIVTSTLLALAYYLYEAIMVSFYQTAPVFYSQYFLARDGLPFLLLHVPAGLWFYAAAISGLIILLSLLVGLVNALLTCGADPQLSRWVRSSSVILAVLGLTATLRYQHYTAAPEMVISSLFWKLEHNVSDSIQLQHDIASFDDQVVRHAYDYSPYRLQTRPDIYLIFVESYGSILNRQIKFRKGYTTLLTQLEKELYAAGWSITSALSESPTWGGGSWMAYTSTLFGLRIDTHPQYLALLNKYQVEQYPDLGRYLRNQGYYYAWVSSLSGELGDEEWAKYQRFFGVDRWLRYRDLNYQGNLYGWGPAPPDQYMLHYSDTLLKASTDQPLFFVTITQNSHYPWVPQPTMVADWHSLNQGQSFPDPSPLAEADTVTKYQNYQKAVDYQLRMLSEFIQQHDAPALFILLGDHQPPQVSHRLDGWNTPVHIISQDQALLERFADYGFTPGLQVKSEKTELHHEGFYSLLVRVLNAHYGEDRLALPAYRPRGVVVEPVAHRESVQTKERQP